MARVYQGYVPKYEAILVLTNRETNERRRYSVWLFSNSLATYRDSTGTIHWLKASGDPRRDTWSVSPTTWLYYRVREELGFGRLAQDYWVEETGRTLSRDVGR